MSALQWALLILSVAIVIAVVLISRRDRGMTYRSARVVKDDEEAAPVREQLDIFASPLSDASPSPNRVTPLFEAFDPGDGAGQTRDDFEVDGVVSAPRRAQALDDVRALINSPNPQPIALVDAPLADEAPPIPPIPSGQFDEFGVGRARRRMAPSLDSPPATQVEAPAAPQAPPPPPPERLPPWVRSSSPPPPPASVSRPLSPTSPSRTPGPAFNDATAGAPAVEKPAVPKAPPPKIVALLIVERSGGQISGTKLHSVLAAQGLVYGNKQIYHRMVRNQAVFSVASLVKPGFLVPAEAAQFSTLGLSAFLVLPGPVKPVSALHDLLATAQTLARALNAEVYDAKKQPLSSELMRAIQADVEAWARAANL